MKTTTPLLLAAGTQSKALVFWTRPHGHDAAQEPVLLIRLCDLILLMHGDHVFDFAEDMYNLAVETGTQFYITTEKEAICQKASDACFEPLPLPARYSMSLYLQLFFPYQDCVLLLLQIHYHKMACSLKMKAGRMDASSMYMSRLQLLDRAKKQFTLEFGGASNKSLVAFDRLEFRTTQLLQSLYGVEEGPLMDRLQNPNMIADRAKYIRASHHILKNLTQQDLLYVNMVTVLDPTRMEKTWATTFLAAMIEGYYVYYGTKKNLHLSSVQQAAQEQFRQLIGGVQTKSGDDEASVPKKKRIRRKRNDKKEMQSNASVVVQEEDLEDTKAQEPVKEESIQEVSHNDVLLYDDDEPAYHEPHVWCSFEECPCHEQFSFNASTKDICSFYEAYVAAHYGQATQEQGFE